MATKRLTKQRTRTGTYAGYVRVSTAKQDISPDVQRARIAAKAIIMGDVAVELVEERESARTVAKRPVLTDLLARCDSGEFDGLIVAKLDRLARNTQDFLALVDRAVANGWALVVMDLDFDTSSATGRLIATMMSAVAEWERRIISERTSAALEQRRTDGARLGRPATLAAEVRERIASDRAQGTSFAKIAEALNADEIPTSQGGAKWYPSSVNSVIASLERDAYASERADRSAPPIQKLTADSEGDEN